MAGADDGTGVDAGSAAGVDWGCWSSDMLFQCPAGLRQESMALSTQQELVLAECRMAFERLDQAADMLDSRTMGLVQASALLLALVGVVRLPGFVTGPVNGWQVAAVGVALLAFAGMIGLLLLALLPRVYVLPGSLDWDELFNDYVNVSEDDCFAQVLNNLIKATEERQAVNGRKGLCLRWAIVLFIVQIVGLLSVSML